MKAFNTRPFCCFFSLVFFASAAFADDLSDIVSVWKARQAHVVSADIEWTEYHVENCFLGQTLPSGAPVPAGEMDYTLKKRLRIEGSNIRYDFSGNRFDCGAWQQEDGSKVYDGHSNVEFRLANEEHEYPVGFVYKADDPPAAVRVMHTTPILAALRPLDQSLKGFAPGQLVLEPRDGVIGTAKCKIIRVGTRRKLWVDPSLGYAIVRIVHVGRNQKPTRQYDIEYEMSGRTPVPKSWTISIVSSGTVVQSTVTRKEINPGSIKKSDFSIVFPVGTVVTDMSSPEKIVDYVVKEDNPKRVIARSEASATHEQWMATDTGEINALGNKGKRN